MVRRQLAALLGLAVAAAAGGEHDRRRRRSRAPPQRARQPFSRPLELGERADFGKGLDAEPSDGLAQRRRDRVAGAVADLEQALARRAAAAREPVAAVLARELDAELLEPVDRGRRLAGEDLDELAVGGLVRATSRRPRRAARASRPRRRPPGSRPAPWPSCTTGASPSSTSATRAPARCGGDGRGEAGGAAADHEHVK